MWTGGEVSQIKVPKVMDKDKQHDYNRSEKSKIVQKRYADTENGKRVRRNNNLRSKYDITLEQYEQMFEDQIGLCDICGNPETAKNRYGKRTLSVDHNHKTKEVRSLLCDSCNRMIGHAKENPDTLRTAATYLENHKQKEI